MISCETYFTSTHVAHYNELKTFSISYERGLLSFSENIQS